MDEKELKKTNLVKDEKYPNIILKENKDFKNPSELTREEILHFDLFNVTLTYSNRFDNTICSYFLNSLNYDPSCVVRFNHEKLGKKYFGESEFLILMMKLGIRIDSEKALSKNITFKKPGRLVVKKVDDNFIYYYQVWLTSKKYVQSIIPNQVMRLIDDCIKNNYCKPFQFELVESVIEDDNAFSLED